MYSLNVFDTCHVQPTWNDIYFGIKNKFLDLESVREYAMRCLELNDVYCQAVAELAWPNNDILSVTESIEKILDENHDLNGDVASIKWQYCIVKTLVKETMNFEDLSSRLDEVYADFDYPEDMEEFISYMPIKDGYNPMAHAKEENIKRILKKIDVFLEKKKWEIG